MNVLLSSFIDNTKVQALRMAVNDNSKAFLPHQFWLNQALLKLQKIDYKNVITNKNTGIICLSGILPISKTDLTQF